MNLQVQLRSKHPLMAQGTPVLHFHSLLAPSYRYIPNS